jgi:glutamate dehydrogenase (NAD(P)+)
LREDGAKIVCIVERDGYLWSEEGLDVEAVKRHHVATGSILGYQGAFSSENCDEGLTQPCDILIPAAMEGAITHSNANAIRAKLIAEAANGPIAFEAEAALMRNGVVILPDLFVNAGGVIVSYFEWVKNLTHIPFGLMERRRRERRNLQITNALETMTHERFPEDMRDEFLGGGAEIDLVRSGLEDVMTAAYEELATALAARPQLKNFRTAAYVIALNRIAEAYKAIGI